MIDFQKKMILLFFPQQQKYFPPHFCALGGLRNKDLHPCFYLVSFHFTFAHQNIIYIV